MTDNKKRLSKFSLGLCIYAGVFLLISFIGLVIFWDYMKAYEQTRPATALQEYAQQLTAQHICDLSEELVDRVDHTLQTAEQCRSTILDSLTGDLTFVKKATESTESKHIYMILSGNQRIGTVELSQRESASYGFASWRVTAENFDLSYLLTQEVEITVPASFKVSVFGNLASDAHISNDRVPYPLLEKLYDDYTLPYLNTYTLGSFLGQPQITVTDGSGTEITLTEEMDFSDYLPACTQQQIASLDTAADTFVRRYVDFISKKNDDTSGNYSRLTACLVPNSDLQKRAYGILDGLLWVSDRKASLESLNIHRYVDLGDNRYMCELTYVVNTSTHAGTTKSENNVMVVFQNTSTGLKAEMMVNE